MISYQSSFLKSLYISLASPPNYFKENENNSRSNEQKPMSKPTEPMTPKAILLDLLSSAPFSCSLILTIAYLAYAIFFLNEYISPSSFSEIRLVNYSTRLSSK